MFYLVARWSYPMLPYFRAMTQIYQILKQVRRNTLDSHKIKPNSLAPEEINP